MTPTVSAPLGQRRHAGIHVAWCIGRAVDSVRAQDFRARELIVVNDGSTDGTRALLDAYGNAITTIDQPNAGCRPHDAGIRRLAARMLRFSMPTIGGCRRSFAAGRTDAEPAEIGFCSTTARVEDGDGRLLTSGAAQWEHGDSCHAFCAERCDRRRLLGGHGAHGPPEARWRLRREPRWLEDPDLWMRLAAVSGYACIDEALASSFAAKRASAATSTGCGPRRCARCTRTVTCCRRRCAEASGATAWQAPIRTTPNRPIGRAVSVSPMQIHCVPSCSPPEAAAGCAWGSSAISC